MTTRLLSNDKCRVSAFQFTEISKVDILHKLRELVNFTSRQIVENLQREAKNQPNGFDPKETFLNGALNTVTSFILSDRLDFGHPGTVRKYRKTQNLDLIPFS